MKLVNICKYLKEVSDIDTSSIDNSFLAKFDHNFKTLSDDTYSKVLEIVQEYHKIFNLYMNKSFVLLRGENSSDEILYRTIRKDRKPRDSALAIDETFEIYRAKYYPNVPSRRKSIFGYKFKNIDTDTTGYGINDYIIFPSHDAKYFSSMETVDFFDSNQYADIIKAMEEYEYINNIEIFGSDVKDIVSKVNLDNFIDYFVNEKKDNLPPAIWQARISLAEYFTNSSDNLATIKPNFEIIIEATMYTAIRKDIFESFVLMNVERED